MGFPKARGHGLQHRHCRSEGIDTTPAFAPLFRDGQRGLVVVRTFNEGPEDEKSRTVQHTIDPHEDAPMAFAVLWRKFETPTGDLFACVQVTVPTNDLILTLGADVNRMPPSSTRKTGRRGLEAEANAAEVNALLRTKGGVRWTMGREEKAAQAKKETTKPTVREPTPGPFY